MGNNGTPHTMKEKASRLKDNIKKALETAAKEIEGKIANGISIDVL